MEIYFSKIKSIFSTSDKFTEINDINKYLKSLLKKIFTEKNI